MRLLSFYLSVLIIGTSCQKDFGYLNIPKPSFEKKYFVGLQSIVNGDSALILRLSVEKIQENNVLNKAIITSWEVTSLDSTYVINGLEYSIKHFNAISPIKMKVIIEGTDSLFYTFNIIEPINTDSVSAYFDYSSSSFNPKLKHNILDEFSKYSYISNNIILRGVELSNNKSLDAFFNFFQDGKCLRYGYQTNQDSFVFILRKFNAGDKTQSYLIDVNTGLPSTALGQPASSSIFNINEGLFYGLHSNYSTKNFKVSKFDYSEKIILISLMNQFDENLIEKGYTITKVDFGFRGNHISGFLINQNIKYDISNNFLEISYNSLASKLELCSDNFQKMFSTDKEFALRVYYKDTQNRSRSILTNGLLLREKTTIKLLINE